MSTEIFNEALADAFRDVVLELAAVFDIHDVADDAIWASMRRLDRANATLVIATGCPPLDTSCSGLTLTESLMAMRRYCPVTLSDSRVSGSFSSNSPWR